MNNLVYKADPAVVAPQVEELLRAEIGATSPVPYELVNPGAAHNAGTVMSDILGSLFGGGLTVSFSLHFRIPEPRPTLLVVSIIRKDAMVVNNCYAGSLLYSTHIAKPVASAVTLGPSPMFSAASFAGDATAIAKLNASKELRKKADKFAMVSGGLTGFEIKMPRQFTIAPEAGGALVVVNTLPRSTKMGLSAKFGCHEFFEIAGLVEAAL